MVRYHNPTRQSSSHCSSRPTSLACKDVWTFPDVFVATKNIYFSQEVGPSPSMFAATKTGILSQNIIFTHPNQVVSVR